MKALTAAEMREVDRLTTSRHGISSEALMEGAGKSVAEAVTQFCSNDFRKRAPRITVLCGKGNNGGDGFVAARYLLSNGLAPRVYLISDTGDLGGDAAANAQRWRAAGGEIQALPGDASWLEFAPDVIVDALLGTGLRGAATGAFERAIRQINDYSRDATAARPALVLAVDTPSGLPSDGEAAQGAVVRAHRTITFTAPKTGQLTSPDAASCGRLCVQPIGSPATLVEEVGHSNLRMSEAREFAALPLVRQAAAHKGTFGHVLLIAGSTGKTGAAALAGVGALRTGAGLVTIATPQEALPTVAAARPEYMTTALAETVDGAIARSNAEPRAFERLCAGKTVLAMGPGLGTEKETQEFIRAAATSAELPVILDADALNAFAGSAFALRQQKSEFLAMTPHPGEMARLLGCSTEDVQRDRLAAALEGARRFQAYVVLKGYGTLIASPDGRIFANANGNAGLAKGGSGDVLTGVLAALTVQFGTADWLRVLALGVHLHGAAADVLAGRIDVSGVCALDVADAIPLARQHLIQEIRLL
jgi:NAD(P)H-hydrate epimerase